MVPFKKSNVSPWLKLMGLMKNRSLKNRVIHIYFEFFQFFSNAFGHFCIYTNRDCC